jgi:superfamily II DNA/RNA helicase
MNLAVPSHANAPSFAELGVPETLVAALATRGVTTPFPIQAATLVDTLNGRDLIGRGRTGSGKTIAFALPTVVSLSRGGRARPGRPRALILVPTRELAAQVADAIVPLAAAVGLRVSTIYGGVSQGSQVKALASGVDVVVACPGRLEDLIGQGHCRLDQIEISVLDEADHMADLGFLPAVRRLLDQTPGSAQRLLFSATLDNAIDQLVRRYLKDPVTRSVDSVDSPVPDMVHHLLTVAAGDKAAVVRELAAGHNRTLLFTRTKHGAKKLAAQLTKHGIPSVELHGNLSQPARTRNLALFARGEVRVLVATDIAARGIHVDGIDVVVHVDPPAEHKAYLHRSGRTARAGASGVVVTIAIPEQRLEVQRLAGKAAIKPRTDEVGPGHPLLGELAGPPHTVVSPGDSGRRPERDAGPIEPVRQGASARPAGSERPRRRRGPRRSGSPRSSQVRSSRPGS